jgi:hypothetical protein
VENNPPDILDMEMAIQSMRNYQASSTDNININPYKKGGQPLINMLRSLIRRMWIEERESAYRVKNKYHSSNV